MVELTNDISDTANGIGVDEVPPELQDLKWVEIASMVALLSNPHFEVIIDNFNKGIRDFRFIPCKVCERLYRQSELDEVPLTDFLRTLLPADFSSDIVMICADCKKVAVPPQGKVPTMPPMTAANGMGVDEVPPELQDLNWVETVLVQLAKPFQTMIKLKPYGHRQLNLVRASREEQPTLQEHHNALEHWITSCVYNGDVYVFDSLLSIHRDIDSQLCHVYHHFTSESQLVVNTVNCQQQDDYELCRVMAIAFAMESVMNGFYPAILAWFDQPQMRKWLATCLEAKKFHLCPNTGTTK
uniref:DUF6570 domain-containing protein n=1 Tax=Plectus sambesii TaxID=2011161 RepID=A0A914W3E2_9BILA